MENKLILNSTELTGILGKSEIEKLSVVVEKDEWIKYRKNYDKLDQPNKILLK